MVFESELLASFGGASRGGLAFWAGWWGIGLLVLHAGELSGPGVAADRSVRTPASFQRRANNAAAEPIDRAGERTPAATESMTADDRQSAVRRE